MKMTFSPTSNDILDTIEETIPLSPELRQWYTTAAPSNSYIDAYGEDIEFYNPSILVECQKGYRWSISPTGEKQLDSVHWNMNWVVIADFAADPVIAHTDRPNTPISGDIHGSGGWQPRLIAPSLSIFLRMIVTWINVRNLQYHGEFVDPDTLSPMSQFVADLNLALSVFVEDPYPANFNWFIL